MTTPARRLAAVVLTAVVSLTAVGATAGTAHASGDTSWGGFASKTDATKAGAIE